MGTIFEPKKLHLKPNIITQTNTFFDKRIF